MKTPNHFTVTNERSLLYYLTDTQVKKLDRLFPGFFDNTREGRDRHEEALAWIEKNGRLIGRVECYAY